MMLATPWADFVLCTAVTACTGWAVGVL